MRFMITCTDCTRVSRVWPELKGLVAHQHYDEIDVETPEDLIAISDATGHILVVVPTSTQPILEIYNDYRE